MIWQNAAIMTNGRHAATQWTAQARQTYYFMAEDLYWENPAKNTAVRLGRISPEEALLRMTKFAYTTFTEKK